MLSRAGAAGERAARRVLHGRATTTGETDAAAVRVVRVSGAQDGLATASGSARASSARRRSRRSASCSRRCPADYVQITSGLGDAPPLSIVVVPIIFEGGGEGRDRAGVVRPLHAGSSSRFLEQLLESLGIVVATIEATMRTDELLRQSQRLTEELQSQQEELQQTNEELEEKAHQLTEQKAEVERKNREVETRQAGAGGEGRAAGAHLALQERSSWPTCRTSCARRSTAC